MSECVCLLLFYAQTGRLTLKIKFAMEVADIQNLPIRLISELCSAPVG